MDFLIKVFISVSAVLLSGSIIGILLMWKAQAILEVQIKRIEEDLARLREEFKLIESLDQDIHSDLARVGEKLDTLLRRGNSRETV